MFFRKPRQSFNDTPAPPVQATVIARDATLAGDIDSGGDVHVDGVLRGAVRAVLCIVGNDGRIEGEVTADEVVVSGQVIGPIRGRHVHLRAGARVEGDITNQTLTVDGGAELNGAVWRQDDPLGERQQALPAADAPVTDAASLFSQSLWNSRGNDDFRPLKAIRPQR